jgi:hypothetical protein
VPIKPKPRKRNRNGQYVPNEKATAFGGLSARLDRSHKVQRTPLPGALQLGNADIVAAANEAFWADIEARRPTIGRSGRLEALLMSKFDCSRSTAQRAMTDAKLVRAAEAEAARPLLRFRVTEQLHRIADREEEAQPLAAVAALREIARIGGLYEPVKVSVVPSEQLELETIVKVLPPAAKAALDVVLEGIEWARAQGLLPAAGGTGEPEQIVDAEIVEPDPGSGN